jgi:hypothetical protein
VVRSGALDLRQGKAASRRGHSLPPVGPPWPGRECGHEPLINFYSTQRSTHKQGTMVATRAFSCLAKIFGSSRSKTHDHRKKHLDLIGVNEKQKTSNRPAAAFADGAGGRDFFLWGPAITEAFFPI